ncbi:hypothetical protein ACGFZL_22485 [Streptomyces sp. NPDC048182]|uniref:hypothetical protein n=1 Tax=Streptomyces sp. NPDC048182 TaxID=3365507 RepID=UPI00371B0B10
MRNPNPREADFFVKVQWKDSAGNTAGESGRTITVPAKGVGTARISAASSGVADRYDHCHVEPRVDGIW